MKSKLIITCVCIGMLGSSVACAADEEATTVNAESASQQSENDNSQDPAAKSAKNDDSPSGKLSPNERAARHFQQRARAKLTHADCFPKSVPDSAHSNAKTCISLAKSAPDMLFSKSDYDNMPEECKSLVPPKCR